MKLVIQRVSSASVVVDNKTTADIGTGLLILQGVTHEDSTEDVDWLVNKVMNMRIFSDEAGLMNLSVKNINGSIIVVSQFTLYASTKKGNRPSFLQAAKPDVAIPLYELFVSKLISASGLDVQTGVFGGDMKVSLLNDGPVTIIIDSKNRT